MRTLLLVLGISALVAGCVKSNPDYAAGGDVDLGLGGPAIPGPGPGGLDMATPDPASSVDLAQPPKEEDPDPPMSEPDLAPPTPGDTAGVACGDDVCGDQKYCCLGVGVRYCESPTTVADCAAGKKVRCDGPEDCSGGKSCCINDYGSSCQTDCAAEPEMCHTSADCTEADYCCVRPSGYFSCSKDPC
jgi:hypothetical protein